MNPVRAWNTFWFRPTSARPLGAFRVVVGVLVLTHLALLSVDLDYWLTDRGLLVGDEARAMGGPLRLSPLQWVQDPVSVRVFVAATAAAAVLFTVGWRTRVTGVLLYLLLLSIHHRNIPTNCGPDNLLLAMVFYLMLGPSGAAYSLDARRATRRRGTLAEPLILPWAQRLIQLQLCTIYLNTALIKCNGSAWLGGTALHYVLNNPEVGRFNLSALSAYPIPLNVLTHAALFTEFALSFLLWFRPTRRWVALAGLGLHGGVLFLVNVPLFGELMTACYLTFLDPDELDAVLRAVNPLRWLRRTPAATTAVPGRLDPAHALRGPHTQPIEEFTAEGAEGVERRGEG
jgi:hypothetical protein